MFEGQNHVHAMTTAFGSLGGFAAAPGWWTDASQNAMVQLAALTVLIFQGGGALNWSYSLAVAVVFTILMKMSSSLQVAEEKPAAPAQQGANGDAAAAAAAAAAAQEANGAEAGENADEAAATEYYYNY
jgi:hypothetical protein